MKLKELKDFSIFDESLLFDNIYIVRSKKKKKKNEFEGENLREMTVII